MQVDQVRRELIEVFDHALCFLAVAESMFIKHECLKRLIHITKKVCHTIGIHV